jgi:hypothetical protein
LTGFSAKNVATGELQFSVNKSALHRADLNIEFCGAPNRTKRRCHLGVGSFGVGTRHQLYIESGVPIRALPYLGSGSSRYSEQRPARRRKPHLSATPGGRDTRIPKTNSLSGINPQKYWDWDNPAHRRRGELGFSLLGFPQPTLTSPRGKLGPVGPKKFSKQTTRNEGREIPNTKAQNRRLIRPILRKLLDWTQTGPSGSSFFDKP